MGYRFPSPFAFLAPKACPHCERNRIEARRALDNAMIHRGTALLAIEQEAKKGSR
jgi:hypothetical protein